MILSARDERRVQRARRLEHVAQHAVDAEAHDRARFVGLEVQVGGALAQRLQQQRVDHPDHRRLRLAAVEQVLRARQLLHQPREVAVAREVLDHERRAGAAPGVVGARELEREALGVDGAREQRPLQHAAQLREALDGRVGPRQHDDARRPPRLTRARRARARTRRESGARGAAAEAIARRSHATAAVRAPPNGGAGRRVASTAGSPAAASAGRASTRRACPGIRPSGGSAGVVGSFQKSAVPGVHALLLALQVLVALRRDLAAVGARAQHRRLEEDHQVGLLAPPRVVAEQRARRPGCRRAPAPCRCRRSARSSIRPPSTMICVVVDDHRRFERALRQDDAGRAGRRPGCATLPGRSRGAPCRPR